MLQIISDTIIIIHHVRNTDSCPWTPHEDVPVCSGEKSQVKLLTSHSTAGLGQYSLTKMKCRNNPSSSRDQVPQKDIVVQDCSQHPHHAGLTPKWARRWGEDFHAYVPSQPH